MLRKITSPSGIDEGKLMAVYAESNMENTAYFYPKETDKAAAVAKVEAGFLDFLKNEFFQYTKAACWVWEENGVWLSALRTCEIEDGLYYLEALETRPDCRKMGYGSALLAAVVEALKAAGSFRLCDCVSKGNAASLKTHEKCGFQIVSECGYDYLHQEADERDYGLEYRYLSE